jgi:two-component system nitrogen regulation response regulator NtrX
MTKQISEKWFLISLKKKAFPPRTASNSAQVFDAIADKIPSAIVLDIWLQGSDLDGLGILEIIKKRYPLMPVVIISGHGTIETAVSAIKIGAYDYIEKPFTPEKLLIVLKRACEASRLKRENLDLRSKVVDRSEVIGNSAAIIKLKNEIDKVAPTSGRVMLYGEPGTGKELTARLLHKKSKSANGPFMSFFTHRNVSGTYQTRIVCRARKAGCKRCVY